MIKDKEQPIFLFKEPVSIQREKEKSKKILVKFHSLMNIYIPNEKRRNQAAMLLMTFYQIVKLKRQS